MSSPNVVTKVTSKFDDNNASGKKISEFQKLGKELGGIGLLGNASNEPNVPKPTMKKLLDGKINYNQGFGIDKGYNTVKESENTRNDPSYRINQGHLNTIQYHN